jgi:hypothetical protein
MNPNLDAAVDAPIAFLFHAAYQWPGASERYEDLGYFGAS